jgi:hypothetical protein
VNEVGTVATLQARLVVEFELSGRRRWRPRLAVVVALYAVLVAWHVLELHRDRLTWSLSPDVIRTEA